MSKELTPLEIIIIKLKDKDNKYDRRVVNCKHEILYLIKQEELDILETALVDNECYKKQITNLEDLCEKHYDKMEKDSMKLKALEIIKEKNVDILRIKITQNVEQYNNRKIKGCRKLIQEEYELLKEVLL